jgi:predicted lactoylglutathione lyase
VTNATLSGLMTAILPCIDLDASERFYNRLGFSRPDGENPQKGEPDTYRHAVERQGRTPASNGCG